VELHNIGLSFPSPSTSKFCCAPARCRFVTLCSLVLLPVGLLLSFHAGARKELLYQFVIVPLWVSYLVRGMRGKPFLAAKAFSMASCSTCISLMNPWRPFSTALSPGSCADTHLHAFVVLPI